MLSERMQCNLLYRRFVADEDIAIDPFKLAEPWRTIYLLADRDPDIIIGTTPLFNAANAVADGDYDERQRLTDAIYASAEPMHFLSLAEIAANLEPVTWLWENWVPRGMLSMVGAYQGTGKSYLVMDLVRIVLHGGAWPDGASLLHDPATAKIIYVDAEGIPQVNSARATALGVDTKRMYLLTADIGEMLDLTRQHWRDRLLDLAYAVDPQLIIVDSLNTITTAGTKSVEDVSGMLTFLNGVAREFDVALLLVHHLRKPGGGQLMLPGISIHDFQGSAHITAMARSVIGMSVVQQKGKQFSLNGPRQIEIVKTNLTPRYPERLEVKLEQPTPDTIRFTYGKVEPADGGAEPTPEEWLVEYLASNGPTAFGDLVVDAEQDGFSKATLYRARKRLGNRIVDSGRRQSRGNQWLLAEQQGEDGADDDETGEGDDIDK